MKLPWAQLRVVFRREAAKSLVARRSWWIYLLAVAPFLLFFAYSVQLHLDARQRQALAAEQQHPITPQDIAGIHRGMTEAEVIARLGQPARRMQFYRRRRTADNSIEVAADEYLRYSDGSTLYWVTIVNGVAGPVRTRPAPTLGDLNQLFATVFQFFYLRLAVFFGCLGIFMNLFRGELLDKSLHFYFLAPVRREWVLAAKFAAGLLAAVVVFGGSTLLQLVMLSHVANGAGVQHWSAYLGITALACLGYGAVFLAAGLIFRNPIGPAAALLVWESLSPFLPVLLKKISIIYYLGQLVPVSVKAGPGISPLFALLEANPDTISRTAATLGLLLLTTVVLFYAARRVRRMEIDYTSE